MTTETTEPLTVRALLEALQAVPPDAIVVADGCDCWGDAVSVRMIEDYDRYDEAVGHYVVVPAVLIARKQT